LLLWVLVVRAVLAAQALLLEQVALTLHLAWLQLPLLVVVVRLEMVKALVYQEALAVVALVVLAVLELLVKEVLVEAAQAVRQTMVEEAVVVLLL
jgi:hypothetical protein